MRLDAPGVSVDLPPGWEGEVDGGSGLDRSGLRTPRIHLANFPLPTDRGDFGSNAVERMQRGDSLVCILEEAADASASVLHDRQGIPTLAVADFGAQAMQRPRSGQAGAQAFFHVGERAFVLYVVIAEQVRRSEQVAEINCVLAGVTFR